MAEQPGRVLIDCQLTEAGWSVQGGKNLDLYAAQDVAVREVIMAAGHGRTDYLPAPEVIAREIVEDLTAALVEFEAVAAALEAASVPD